MPRGKPDKQGDRSPETGAVPDEAAIRAFTGRESYERGRSYHRSGAVSGLVARDGEVSAAVQGSDAAPYRVQLRLDSARIVQAACSCPVGAGGRCKHVVAALLALADDPEAVTQRPSLRQLLAPLDRDALAGLLLKRAAVDPGFVGWIEAEIATMPAPDRAAVDTAPVAAQARAVLSGRYQARDYWDDYRARGNVPELKALVEKAVPFLEAGDGRNALGVLEAVTEVFVDDWIAYASGSDEEMYEMFHDLGQMMAEAALMSDLNDGEREILAVTLEDWQDRLSDYGVEDAFDLAAHALRKGWDDPKLQAILEGGRGLWPDETGLRDAPALDPEDEDGEAFEEPDDDADDDDFEEDEDVDEESGEERLPIRVFDDVAAWADDPHWLERTLVPVRLRVLDAAGRSDAYLNLARASGAHTEVATMLVRLGRIEEAVAHAGTTFTLPDASLALAKALVQAGARDAAFGIAQDGIRLGAAPTDAPYRPGRSIVPLARWLREEAAAAGRADLALSAARTAFVRTLARADFHAVRPLAGDAWGDVRIDLVAALIADARGGDRVEILLDEGLTDEAVTSVGRVARYATSEDVLLRLMEAAYASHPDWVIGLAEGKAEAIMDRGSAGHYDRAAEWLGHAAKAYDAAGRIDDWSARIEGLIATHRRKYKLRPLLEALRFGG